MTMRNRGRKVPQTPRKDRQWVTSESTLSLVAAGVSGQQINAVMGNDFEAALDRRLRKGDTIRRVYVTGYILNSTAIPVTEGNFVELGLTVARDAIDAGEFQDVGTHIGDWMAHKIIPIRGSGVIGTTVDSREDGFFEFESEGSRTIPAIGQRPTWVGQLNTTPSSGAIEVTFYTTILWLLSG